VPVALAQEWGNVAAPAGAGGVVIARAAVAAAPAQIAANRARMMDKTCDRLRSAPRARLRGAAPPPPAPGADELLDLLRADDAVLRDEAAELKPRAPRGDLHRLLATQSAAGVFARVPELSAMAERELSGWSTKRSEIERACVAMIPAAEPVIMAAAIATVEGLLLLNSVFAADAATWKRAADKAVRYLAKLSGRSVAEIENWLVKLQLGG
jgi:hypothetical protein